MGRLSPYLKATAGPHCVSASGAYSTCTFALAAMSTDEFPTIT